MKYVSESKDWNKGINDCIKRGKTWMHKIKKEWMKGRSERINEKDEKDMNDWINETLFFYWKKKLFHNFVQKFKIKVLFFIKIRNIGSIWIQWQWDYVRNEYSSQVKIVLMILVLTTWTNF